MQEDGAEAGGLGCSEMLGTGEDRPSGCEGAGDGRGGSGSGQGRGDGRSIDGAVGDNGFGTEDRGYNIAH